MVPRLVAKYHGSLGCLRRHRDPLGRLSDTLQQKGHVDPELSGRAMVNSVAHPFNEAQPPGLQSFLSELPAHTIGFGYAAALLEADHIVEVLAFKPGKEADQTEAPIGQDHGRTLVGSALTTAKRASCSSWFWLLLVASRRSRS